MSDPDATIELCRPENEAEALGIEAELKANGVEPLLERRASTAYPGIVDRGGWGVIRVRAVQASRARVLLEAWLAERGDDEMDEEELALAAMEADDADPDEIALRRAQLARVDRGGAYRAPKLLAKTDPARPLAPNARPKWSTVLLVASLGLNLLLLWEHLRVRGETRGASSIDGGSLVDEDGDGRFDAMRCAGGDRYELSCP